MTDTSHDDASTREEERVSRIWFYRPTFYWFGRASLLPVQRGHDEYARWTVMIGWPITGRIIIALGDCGRPECWEEARLYREFND